MQSSLHSFLATHQPLVTKEVKRFFATQRKLSVRLSPYLTQSVDRLSEFSLRGGKGIRPLLVILSYRMAGGVDSAIYAVAAGVELFHKHLLNLDDMADRDEQRNGGASIWFSYQQHFAQLKWPDPAHHGRTLAEIDGTLLGSFAFELVRTAAISDSAKIKIIGIMNELMYGQTVAGWQLQYFQNHQQLEEVSEEEFMKGLDLVTAQYTFVAPLQIGLAAAASNDKNLLKALTQYGEFVGRAFQVQDDILGLYGDPAETGKPVGNDVREGKKTLLLQRAYHAADTKDQNFLEDVCGRNLSQAELKRVQELVKSTGSLAYSQQLAEESVKKGIAELDKLPDSAEKNVLKELALFVIQRRK